MNLINNKSNNNINNINKIKKLFYDFIILGAGPASLFLSFLLSKDIIKKNKNIKILILEKENIIGKKLLLSGKGKCNYTSSIISKEEFLKNYPRGKNFFKKIFYEFDNLNFINLLEKNGIKTIKEGKKCFPASKSSKEVLNLFVSNISKSQNFEIIKNCQVLEINYLKNHKNNLINFIEAKINSKEYSIEILDKINFFIKFSTKEKENFVFSNYLVLATGGLLNYKPFIEGININFSKISPALYGFELEDEFNELIRFCQGVTLKNIEVKIEGTSYKYIGDIIFTHKGISGPAILNLTSLGAYYINDKNFKINLILNLIYNKDLTKIKTKIKDNKNKLLKNSNYIFGLPYNFFKIILKFFFLKDKNTFNEDKIKLNFLEDEKNFNNFISFLNNFKLKTKSKSNIQAEYVTAGGIELNQISSNGLFFKNYPELFAIGEILNIDGLTGGFNLQNCWSSAYQVYKEIKKRLKI